MFAIRCLLVALVLACGCGHIRFDEQPKTWTFVDDDEATFALGSHDPDAAALIWSDDRLQLAGPPFDPQLSGVFVSRPFATGDPGARWTTLAWSADAPHGRALPDDGGADVGYSEGVSMADNILLLHLDGTGAPAGGAMVADRSGADHHGAIVLAGDAATYVPGAFGEALELGRAAWVTLDGNYFDYGTGDFTYAIWVQIPACEEGDNNRVAMGGGDEDDAPHIWIGARCPDTCSDQTSVDLVLRDETRDGLGLNGCSGIDLGDGAWHHLALVKQGHTAPASEVRLYVDGQVVAVGSHDFANRSISYQNGEIRLGSFNLEDPKYHTRVTVDEAAIWKRALEHDEVVRLFRRGGTHLEFQIRTCPDGTCDTEEFVGPDGTSGTAFRESDLTGPAGEQRDNLAGLGFVGSVAQYRVRFVSSSPWLSPGLLRVTVEARTP